MNASGHDEHNKHKDNYEHIEGDEHNEQKEVPIKFNNEFMGTGPHKMR